MVVIPGPLEDRPMRADVATVGVVALVLLAGCLAGPAGPGEPEGTETPQPGRELPGVDDGRLTNASALVGLTERTATYMGAVIRYNRSGARESVEQRLVFTPGGTPVGLSGTRRLGDRSRAIDLWSNSSVTAVRFETANGTVYRTQARGYRVKRIFRELGQYLRAGTYSVANESVAGDGTVLVADEYVPDGGGPFEGVESFRGRVELDDGGVIRSLSVSAETASGSRTVSFELVRLGTERVHRPDWLADVPETAWLHPELSVDVRESRYLTVENRGEDRLPRNSTVLVTTNGTTYRAQLAGALAPGQTRFVFLDAGGESLSVAEAAPTAAETAPLSSPVEIRVLAPDGRPVHSGGIGWESATASESGG